MDAVCALELSLHDRVGWAMKHSACRKPACVPETARRVKVAAAVPPLGGE